MQYTISLQYYSVHETFDTVSSEFPVSILLTLKELNLVPRTVHKQGSPHSLIYTKNCTVRKKMLEEIVNPPVGRRDCIERFELVVCLPVLLTSPFPAGQE